MSTETGRLADEHVLAWGRMLRVSQRLVDKVEAELKAAGLPPLAWYDLLLELKRAGQDGLRPYRLQEEMLLPQYNISRLIDRIGTAGYVERETCEEDRRGQTVRITKRGRELLRQMWPVYRRVLENGVGARLSVAEAGTLADLLGRLRDSA